MKEKAGGEEEVDMNKTILFIFFSSRRCNKIIINRLGGGGKGEIVGKVDLNFRSCLFLAVGIVSFIPCFFGDFSKTSPCMGQAKIVSSFR